MNLSSWFHVAYLECLLSCFGGCLIRFIFVAGGMGRREQLQHSALLFASRRNQRFPSCRVRRYFKTLQLSCSPGPLPSASKGALQQGPWGTAAELLPLSLGPRLKSRFLEIRTTVIDNTSGPRSLKNGRQKTH